MKINFTFLKNGALLNNEGSKNPKHTAAVVPSHGTYSRKTSLGWNVFGLKGADIRKVLGMTVCMFFDPLSPLFCNLGKLQIRGKKTMPNTQEA